MVEYGCKIEEEVKVMKKCNENIQRTDGEVKETGMTIKDLEQKEEVNIQPEQN